jgi:hypothetical protein
LTASSNALRLPTVDMAADVDKTFSASIQALANS